MSGNPNKLSQFWQELKRRNVARVLAVYIAASFMILELISMFSEQIGLPDGTWKVAFIISLAGLVIAVIISWIYDIHPEGGIVKTEPSSDVSKETAHPSFQSWKIASYISFVVIVGLIVLNVIPRSDKKEILDKSIAVLPFTNDSPDDENVHILNGYMMSITNNLCKIKDLRVITRASVERYRNNPKPIPEIAEELNVGYFLFASGQRFGDHIILTVQLIDANEKLIWSNPYNRKITKVEDQISLQSEIAQLIAGEIQAVITPEEKARIEKVPTSILTAYDLFSRGTEERWKYMSGNKSQITLENAENLFKQAIKDDSTFSLAYTGLAWVFWNKQEFKSVLSEEYLDSVLILTNIALSCDSELSEGYLTRGSYHQSTGNKKLAIKDFNKAIQLNPNEWKAYRELGWLYYQTNLVKSIEYYHKAISLHRGQFLPELYRSISYVYDEAGFRQKAEYFAEKAFGIDGDSLRYLGRLSYIEHVRGNFSEALDIDKKRYALDTSNNRILWDIGNMYTFLKQYDKALEWFNRFLEHSEYFGWANIIGINRVGIACWKSGYKDEGRKYLNQFRLNMISATELGRDIHDHHYNLYNLAAVYAFFGEKERAYEYLKLASKRETHILYWTMYVYHDELFENYHTDSVFQDYVQDVNAKYQAEHERVRQWLEENDML